MRLKARPLRRQDSAAWSRLLAAISEADGDGEYRGKADLADLFGEPLQDFEQGSVAYWDDGAIVGYGLLSGREIAEPVHQMRYEGGVHPAYRRKGLGGRLLAWAEQQAVPLHESRFVGHPLSLTSGCLSTNGQAMALHEARGYVIVRWFHTMVRELKEPLPDAHALDGLRVEGFTAAAHGEDARLVRNEAFQEHWGSVEVSEEAWAHRLAASTFRPQFSFVAYEANEPLGIVLSHENDGKYAATGQRELYIALVGTRAAGRKRGIATGLLSRAMSTAQEAGFDIATLNVDAASLTGAVALYERVGFTVTNSWAVFAKDLLPEQ